MQLTVNGAKVYAATGGKTFDAKLPLAVFLHGGGMDHTVWQLLARWFAHHGCAVLAPDLPAHGRSDGPALTSIAAMADWTAALIAAAGAQKAVLIGHSMGSLVALETASRHPTRVAGLGLIGTAAPMAVTKDLLEASRANSHDAIDMVSIWGEGFRAGIGGSLAPGQWMLGGAMRLLERAPPGTLGADLAACNDYADALAAAAKINVPAVVVIGERDMMTPPRAGRALAAAVPNARVVTIAGAGHMMMSERPDDVLAAVKGLAAV